MLEYDYRIGVSKRGKVINITPLFKGTYVKVIISNLFFIKRVRLLFDSLLSQAHYHP